MSIEDTKDTIYRLLCLEFDTHIAAKLVTEIEHLIDLKVRKATSPPVFGGASRNQRGRQE